MANDSHVMPEEVIRWMDDYSWGIHHLAWHQTRQWDRMPASAQNEMRAQGWQRADRQEGTTGNGLDFLFMHRAMLQLLNEHFSSHSSLFVGWTSPPTDPNDPADPIPASNRSRVFERPMLQAVDRLSNEIAGFQTEDDLGLFIQTQFRPTAANPFARSSDPAAGIHNYLHRRWQEDGDPVNLGEPLVNLGNKLFWKLHGWIDRCWSAYRSVKGLTDTDPNYQRRLAAEKDMMTGLAHHHGRASLRSSFSRAGRPLSASLTRVFRPTLAVAFNELTTEKPDITTKSDLLEYLKMAARLEFFTIPLYLAAKWSILPSTPDLPPKVRERRDDHSAVLQAVVIEEMLHLGFVCNMIRGLGESPMLLDLVPSYPDNLPGIDNPTHFSLESFSASQLEKFLVIEGPQHGPIPDHPVAARSFGAKAKSIGEFYDTIAEGIQRLNPQFDTELQLTASFSPVPLTKIGSAVEAIAAIRVIKEQGEGTPTTQGAPGSGNELAHYYQFNQLKVGFKYVAVTDASGAVSYRLDHGRPIDPLEADDVLPMSPVPDHGYPCIPEAETFDAAFTTMMSELQSAWQATTATDADRALGQAVGSMYSLEEPARVLMRVRRQPPYEPGFYGPDFRIVDLSDEHRCQQQVTAIRSVQINGPTFSTVKQILDAAVQGQSIRAHGAFWRDVTRDEFITRTVFGKPIVTLRHDGTFDPDESNLIKALEGRPPFGSNMNPRPQGATIRRMPSGTFPPIPNEQITVLRQWITNGCPDDPRVVTSPASSSARRVALTVPLTMSTQDHVNFWYEFDQRFMYAVPPAVRDDIGTFFGSAGAWFAAALQSTNEPAWAEALAQPGVAMAVVRLEAEQRIVITRHYGDSLRSSALFDGFEGFGADLLPLDRRRDDPHHRMNGETMWGYWFAFCDAAMRAAQTQASVPIRFWQLVSRAALIGMMNDGIYRKRFTVKGFSEVPDDRGRIRSFVENLDDAGLSGEMFTRMRESGLIS